MNPKQNVVYVASNEEMPGRLKFGITSEENLEQRFDSLYNSSVAKPFVLEYSIYSEKARRVEKRLHDIFNPYRVDNRREFFEVELESVVAVLDIFGEDISCKFPKYWREAQSFSEQSKQKSPKFHFQKMGIPVRSKLFCVNNHDTCKVIDNSRVEYMGDVMTFSEATRLSLNKKSNVQPSKYWTYKGTLLIDLYKNVQLKK